MTHLIAAEDRLDAFRRALLEQRGAEEVRVRNASREPLSRDYVSGDPEAQRARALAAARRRLAETDAALDRLERGGFGICETCGSEISLVRLEILPHARNCVACQRSHQPARTVVA